MLATTIIGILLFTALLGLTLWWTVQILNRAVRESAYRRRILLGVAAFYVLIAVFVIVAVAMRKEPVQALSGLPISAAIIWLFVRAARVHPRQ
jgi:hypothetical protein